jgi:DNA-binding CsgD family transcriptional regulator
LSRQTVTARHPTDFLLASYAVFVDAPALIASVQAALAAGELGTALACLREAVAAGPNPSARQLLGGLLFFDDDLAGTRREWELAFREWKDAGEMGRAALVAADLADLHTSGFGNRVVGQGWISRARRLLEPAGRCPEQGYVELALIACDVDVECLEHAAEMALRLASDFGDAELEVLALADLGYALVVQGRTSEGFAALDEAMAALSAGEVQNFSVIGKSFCALLSACERTGDVARAEEWIRVITGALTGPFGGRPRATHSHCRLAYGSVMCTAGQWSEGEAAIVEVLGPAGSAYLSHRAEAAARLASLRLLQGRVEEAAQLLRPFEDRPSSCEPLARVHFLNGDVDLAGAVARRGLDAAGKDRLREAALRSVLVELELARDAVPAATAHANALQELAEVTDSTVLRAEAALARGRVAAARRDPQAALPSFQEAHSLVDSEQRPVLAGVAALELAHALRDLGDRGGAIDHARGALAIFHRLGAAPLGDRTDALLRSLGARSPSVQRHPTAAVAGLSHRERHVLALLREGLTNAEIGERLFISAKTAEHHVGRVLAKLGVRSRTEAAAVAATAALAADRPGPS